MLTIHSHFIENIEYTYHPSQDWRSWTCMECAEYLDSAEKAFEHLINATPDQEHTVWQRETTSLLGVHHSAPTGLFAYRDDDVDGYVSVAQVKRQYRDQVGPLLAAHSLRVNQDLTIKLLTQELADARRRIAALLDM